MLKNTFCHLPGIGEKTELALWEAGVMSWECDLPHMKISRALRESWRSHMQKSLDNHADRNPNYFADNLPTQEHWRLYQDFQDSCAFLDIETTGLSPFDDITTIVLYDRHTIRYYINCASKKELARLTKSISPNFTDKQVSGKNLDRFPADVMQYRLLVTYNGKSFDIPRIERFFGIQMSQAHIDLMHPLASVGLKGGLKGCERQLGINRPALEGVDGYIAVLLWKEYQKKKDFNALETLLAYNIQDTVALHSLLVHTHNEKVKPTPFSASHALPVPSLPPPPFQANHETVKRLLRQNFMDPQRPVSWL